ncbi:hypothetical protein ACO0R3_001024 [Hanseniaspora guilliermondii]
MDVVSSFFNSQTSSDSNDTNNNHNNDSKESLKPLSQMANQYASEKLIEKLLYMSLPSSASNSLLSNEASLTDFESILKSNKNKYLQIPSSQNSIFSNDKYHLLKLLSYENRMKYAGSRPGLSLQIMSRNFINLNSRLSVPFFIVDVIEEIITWKNNFFTISFMIIVVYMILYPQLILIALPTLIYTQLITPNYYQKYKPNEFLITDRNTFSEQPILNTVNIQPEKELSKEFILNITDLQNRMSLYIEAWDFIVSKLNKFLLWKDEDKTILTTALLFVTIAMCLLLKIHFKPILIVLFLSLMIVNHPKIKSKLFIFLYSEDTRLKLLTMTNRFQDTITKEIEVSHNGDIIKTCKALMRQKKVGMNWETVLSLDDYSPPINYVFLENSPWKMVLTQNDQQALNNDNWIYTEDEQFRERVYVRHCLRESFTKDETKQFDKDDYDGFLVL